MIPVSKFVKVFFFSTNNKVSYVKKTKTNDNGFCNQI